MDGGGSRGRPSERARWSHTHTQQSQSPPPLPLSRLSYIINTLYPFDLSIPRSQPLIRTPHLLATAIIHQEFVEVYIDEPTRHKESHFRRQLPYQHNCITTITRSTLFCSYPSYTRTDQRSTHVKLLHYNVSSSPSLSAAYTLTDSHLLFRLASQARQEEVSSSDHRLLPTPPRYHRLVIRQQGTPGYRCYSRYRRL
jgi:hypothetical protein